MSRFVIVIPTTVPLEAAEEVADPGQCVEDLVLRSLEAQMLRRSVRALPRFEGKVLALRYGLDGEGPATVRECARFLHCSPTLVHKTERRALEALRDQFEPDGDKPKSHAEGTRLEVKGAPLPTAGLQDPSARA